MAENFEGSSWIDAAVLDNENWLPIFYAPAYLDLDRALRENQAGYAELSDFVRLVPQQPIEAAEDTGWIAVFETGKIKFLPSAAALEIPEKLFRLPKEALLVPRTAFGTARVKYWDEGLFSSAGAAGSVFLVFEPTSDASIAWLAHELEESYCQLQLARHFKGSIFSHITAAEVLATKVVRKPSEDREKTGWLVRQQTALEKEQLRLEAFKGTTAAPVVLTGSTFEERREQFEDYLLHAEVGAQPIAFVEASTTNRNSELFLVRLLEPATRSTGEFPVRKSEPNDVTKRWRSWYWSEHEKTCIFHSLALETDHVLPSYLLSRIAPALVNGPKIGGSPEGGKAATGGKFADRIGFRDLANIFTIRLLERGLDGLEEAKQNLGDSLKNLLALDSVTPEFVESVFQHYRKLYRPLLALKVFRDGKIVGSYVLAAGDQFQDPQGEYTKLQSTAEKLLAVLETPKDQVEELTRRESLRRLSWLMHQINGPLFLAMSALSDLDAFIKANAELGNHLVPDEASANRMSVMAGQPLQNYQLKHRLKDVEKAVTNIRNLNYQIRRLKRLQGKIQLSAVPLHTLLREALENCASGIPGLRTHCNILKECEVSGDRHLLKDAIEEVFHNSVRELAHRGTSEPILSVEVWSEGDSAWFSIRDNGLPANERLIDKPFDEDASTYANQGKGTGLGLTIVKETFRSHSGKCFLEPNQDLKGTRIAGVTFKGYLPLWPSPSRP